MVKKINLFNRFEIKLTNKWLYSFIVLGIVLILGIGVYATVDKTNAWHSSDQVEVTVDGGSTFTSLQEAIDAGSIGGSGSSLWTSIDGSNISYDGNAYVTGEVTAKSFIYDSDRRLKKNIQVIPNALEKVKALEGVSFEWRADETNDKNLGFIAQDVEKVLPEVVSVNKDGFKAVEYGNIVAVLVEAIKEQQKEIEDLKLRLRD